MTLKQEVDKFINDIPSIEINVEFGYTSKIGVYKEDNYYIDIYDYCIDCEINVVRDGYTDVDSIEVCLNNVYFEGDVESKLILDDVNVGRLEKVITENINIF